MPRADWRRRRTARGPLRPGRRPALRSRYSPVRSRSSLSPAEAAATVAEAGAGRERPERGLLRPARHQRLRRRRCKPLLQYNQRLGSCSSGSGRNRGSSRNYECCIRKQQSLTRLLQPSGSLALGPPARLAARPDRRRPFLRPPARNRLPHRPTHALASSHCFVWQCMRTYARVHVRTCVCNDSFFTAALYTSSPWRGAGPPGRVDRRGRASLVESDQ